MVENMPVAKPVIILTRPAEMNAPFAAAIRASGIKAHIIEAPVTRIDPLIDVDVPSVFTGAIFTSRNGVAHGPAGDGIAWCVGDKTAEAAGARGWQARSASGDAADLFQRICADLKGAEQGAQLVHFCGEETRGDLAERLRDVGISTQLCVVYRQKTNVLSDDAMSAILDPISPIIPIFSPNSARRLIEQFPENTRADFVAISQATADAIPADFVNRLSVAKTPDAQSLIESLRHMI